MRTSESILKLIESNQEKQLIKTGNWKAHKQSEYITIYYHNTLVGYYDKENKSLCVIYDYSVSTKCGLTKIINLLKIFNLIDILTYVNREYKIINQIKL